MAASEAEITCADRSAADFSDRLKLGASDGHPFQHLAALMTGSTQQDYADLMLRGGRSVEGNRSRTGQFDKPKATKSKSASKGKKRRG